MVSGFACFLVELLKDSFAMHVTLMMALEVWRDGIEAAVRALTFILFLRFDRVSYQ